MGKRHSYGGAGGMSGVNLGAIVTPVNTTTGDFDHISLTVWGRIRPSTGSDMGTLQNTVGPTGSAATGNNGRGLPYTGA